MLCVNFYVDRRINNAFNSDCSSIVTVSFYYLHTGQMHGLVQVCVNRKSEERAAVVHRAAARSSANFDSQGNSWTPSPSLSSLFLVESDLSSFSFSPFVSVITVLSTTFSTSTRTPNDCREISSCRLSNLSPPGILLPFHSSLIPYRCRDSSTRRPSMKRTRVKVTEMKMSPSYALGFC